MKPGQEAMWGMHRRRRTAAGKWPQKGTPARNGHSLSWQLRADGARIVINMAEEIASRTNKQFDGIHWLSDPAEEVTHGGGDTYTLVAQTGERFERQVFLREDLEQAPDNEFARERIRTVLKAFLTAPPG
ncbi:MAG: hypothetical protein ACE5K1_03295 [Acidiferrobacterales bacterium]